MPDATAALVAAGLPVGKLAPDLLGHLLRAIGDEDQSLLVGPGVGRDAAAIRFGEVVLVVKTDPITFASHDAASYLVDINANDVACLGARPRWLLVTALLAPGTTEQQVEELFNALLIACERRGIRLVGGHTEITTGLDRTLLIGSLLGETTVERLLRPGGANIGDRLLLTKGLAIEGTALLAKELQRPLTRLIGEKWVEQAGHLLADPGISVVADAERLLTVGGVTALHDPTEGGLATGIRELAAASNCGALLEFRRIPILPETAAICDALAINPLGLLASGSLLVACQLDAVGPLIKASLAAGVSLTEIGELISADQGCLLRRGEVVCTLPEFPIDEANRVLDAQAERSTGKDDAP